MFVTRATRHDRPDIRELLSSHGWDDVDLSEGTAFIARDGGIVGCVRLVEVAPNTLVVDDVLVKEGRRHEGIGRRLMQTVLNSRGGTLYLCCHEERLGFYRHFGFEVLGVEECPSPVVDYWKKVGDYPTEPGHVHYFMKAR